MDVNECGMGRILLCRMQRRSAAVATMRVVTGITQDHLKRPGRDHIVIDDEDFFCRARNAGFGVGLGSIIDGWRVQSGHSRRTPHYVFSSTSVSHVLGENNTERPKGPVALKYRGTSRCRQRDFA